MNNLSNMIKVAVVGGEGIGPEVTAQSHRVLNWFATRRNVPMVLREAQYGLIPYLATGKVLPDDTAEAMEEADAILWGATGGPETKEVPPAARKAGSLLSLRSKYDLYANLRPIVANAALSDSAPLKASVLRGVDFVIIRETPSGICFGGSRGIETQPDGQRRDSTPVLHTQPDTSLHARVHELARTRGAKRSVRSTRRMCWRPACCEREEVIALHAAGIFRHGTQSSLCRATPRCRSCGSRRRIRCDGHRRLSSRHPVRLRSDGVGSLGRMLPSASLGPVDKFGRRKAHTSRCTAARPISPAGASPIRSAPFSASP
jgi:3-isopropylmalate dehydrogenase